MATATQKKRTRRLTKSVYTEVDVDVEIEEADILDWAERHPDELEEILGSTPSATFVVAGSLASTDDQPIRQMIEAFGASRVLLDAIHGSWRCRAWIDGAIIEHFHSRRAAAAAGCLLKLIER